MTGKTTKKAENVIQKPSIYFCLEDGNSPYKGVKGKGVATISDGLKSVISISEKIIMKYFSTLVNPMTKAIDECSRSGEDFILEITPKFFST